MAWESQPASILIAIVMLGIAFEMGIALGKLSFRSKSYGVDDITLIQK